MPSNTVWMRCQTTLAERCLRRMTACMKLSALNAELSLQSRGNAPAGYGVKAAAQKKQQLSPTTEKSATPGTATSTNTTTQC